DIEDFAEELRRLGLNGGTISNILMPARALFRRAVRRGDVATSPLHDLELPAPRRRKRRAAPPAEQRAFPAELSGFDPAFWALAYLAALGVGEILALSWADVDLAASVVTVRRSWDAEAHEAVAPKTESGVRKILPFEAREYLIAHRAAHGGDGFLFPGHR